MASSIKENISQSRKMSWVLSLLFVLCVAVSWILLFKLNELIFTSVSFNEHIAWIFLPAALRMLAVMVFEWLGVLGLFFGAIVTCEAMSFDNFSETMIISGISALGPMLALIICTHLFKLPSSLSGLDLKKLTIFGLIGAACNVIPHNLYFYIADRMETPFAGITPMFIGDVAGTLIVLYVLALLQRFISTDRKARVSRD